MVAFPKSIVYFSILAVLLIKTKTDGRRFNLLDRKSIEAFCPSNQTVHLYLSGYGVRSAIKLNAMHDLIPINSTNCTIVIHTRNSGVILRVDSTYNVRNLHGQCTEYIEVLDEAGKNSTNLCGFRQSSFVSVGNIKFRYQIKYAIMPRSGFTILATAYKKDSENCEEFRCQTGECIWHGFVCDGIANCPDGSDERAMDDPLCFDVPEFTLKPFDFNWHIVLPTSKSILEYRKSFNVTITAAVGSVIFILLFGVMRFVLPHRFLGRQRRTPFRQSVRRISVIHPRPIYQSQFGAPPPPYTSLVNEGQNNVSSTPPSYASVTNEASENNSTSPADENAKQNCLTEPPPPYEP